MNNKLVKQHKFCFIFFIFNCKFKFAINSTLCKLNLNIDHLKTYIRILKLSSHIRYKVPNAFIVDLFVQPYT